MSDILPGVIIMGSGIAIAILCTRGAWREVRFPFGGRRDWGMIGIAGVAAVTGVAILGLGALYLNVVLYGTDL